MKKKLTVFLALFGIFLMLWAVGDAIVGFYRKDTYYLVCAIIDWYIGIHLFTYYGEKA